MASGKVFGVFLLAVLVSVSSAQTSGSGASCSQQVKSGVSIGNREECKASFGNIKHYVSHLAGVTNMLLSSNYEYMQLAAHFAKDTINWDGFSAYFDALSDEAWEHAVALVKYANHRGQNIGHKLDVRFKNRLEQNRYDKTEAEALAFALDRERTSLGSFNGLLLSTGGVSTGGRNDASAIPDPLLNDFVESKFATEGTDTVRELAGLVHTFQKMSGFEEYPMAVFHLNKLLKKLSAN